MCRCNPTHPPESWCQRLVVFADTQVCDTKHEHEVHLVTDGAQAYAYGPTTDCPLIHRAGTVVTVECRQPSGVDREPCGGRATFQLDTEGTWTSVPAQRLLLARYGQKVES